MKHTVRISLAILLVLVTTLFVCGAMADVRISNGKAIRTTSAYAKSPDTARVNIEFLTPVMKANSEGVFRYNIIDPENNLFSTLNGGTIEVWVMYQDEKQRSSGTDGCFGYDGPILTDYSGTITFRIPPNAVNISIEIGYVTIEEDGGRCLHTFQGENVSTFVPVEPVTGMVVREDKLLLYNGQAYWIQPYQAGNEEEKFTFKSSNTKVAYVIDNGILLANAPGKATVTVKGKNGASIKIKVTVKDTPAVKLSKKSVSLKVGQTYQIEPTMKIDAKASSSEKPVFTFKTSAKKIANVDKKTGLVTARKKGIATITVTGTLAGYQKTATLKVTVK